MRSSSPLVAFGVEPGEVVQPISVEEVAEGVAWAKENGKSIIPWGGGTGQDYGYPPRAVDCLLDLSAMDKVLAIEPGDLTVTVQAGARLTDVQAALSSHNQYLPLDPPNADQATLGGILATNAFGPSRVGYGTARDWLIGITVVDALGRVIKGGGKVVKNVTGYDLPKLHVGALGTLGVIVEATFKVAPKPETSGALLFMLTDSGDISLALRNIGARRVSPSLALLHEEGGQRYLFLVWRGSREVVAGEMEATTEIAHTTGLPAPHPLDPEEFTLAEPEGEDMTHLRLTTRAAEAWRVHRSITDLKVATQIQTAPFTGTVEVHCTDADAALRLLAWAAKNGTAASVLHAPLALRQQKDIVLWQPLPPTFPLQQRLKQSLDPNTTLNPGRFVGRI